MTDKTDSKEREADALIRKLRDVLDEARSYIGAPTFSPSMDREAAIAVEEAGSYLAGRASLAANAGSEPVAWHLRIGDNSCWSYCATELDADFYGNQSGLKHEKRPLYTHSSPPEGMVGGWMPIETAPKDGTEILGYTEEVGALVLYWDSMTGEMDHWSDGMSVSFWKPTHWMPLPPPPTSFADSRKGE